MDDEIRSKFERLAVARSPENLTCDGELSRKQVIARHSSIMREWVALEKKVGRKVSLDEIERQMYERRRYGLGYMQGRGAA